VPRYEGRLELTWTNKHERLLAHEDGTYEWLRPSDYRVAEVRLLHDVQAVGQVGPQRAGDNLLIQGDALHALTSLAKLPEFSGEYLGKVKLAYIDPPFNTGQAFKQYDDALEHSVWLTMMRDRLSQIHELLAPGGSVWVHLDDAEMAYCRAVLDELYGRNNFVATVVWQRRDGRPNDAIIGQMHDYILVYAKDIQKFANTRNRLLRTGEQEAAYRNPDHDPRGPWRNDNYTSNKSRDERPNSWFPITRPADGVEIWPKPHAVWRYAPETHKRNVEDDRLWWGASGLNGMPKLKRFRSEVEGIVPMTWWPFTEVGSTRNAKNELKQLFPDIQPFATPKPERLLERVVHIATDPGDIVLDCFAGSGTSGAVAHKMGRRWVMVEQSLDTVSTFTLPRLRMVAAGEDLGGISTAESSTGEGLPEGIRPGEPNNAARVLDTLFKSGALDDVDGIESPTIKALTKALQAADKTSKEILWTGGGGFRVLSVAPSMFESDDGGLVYLADSMANGGLAEASAAQLGYEYKPEPPFAGLKGRTRLAVVDGVVNEGVVRLLVSALGDGERVVICGTGLDPEARPILRELRPGSSLRKIPAALLERYRTPQRRVWREAPGSTVEPVLMGTDA
jgi:adenine-specific DNA-methyltransferase